MNYRTYMFSIYADKDLPMASIYEAAIDTTDVDRLFDVACGMIPDDAERVVLYTNGGVAEVLAVTTACIRAGVELIAMSYDPDTGEWYPQRVTRNNWINQYEVVDGQYRAKSLSRID